MMAILKFVTSLKLQNIFYHNGKRNITINSSILEHIVCQKDCIEDKLSVMLQLIGSADPCSSDANLQRCGAR